MKAEIISIGDELLIGQTVNTNAAWMGAEINKIGFSIVRTVAIADKREDILEALKDAEGKYDIVLITGGLGPTSDDITKPVLCEFFRTKLVLNEEVLEMISKMILKRNYRMNENNRKQAEVPENCRVLLNAAGTAPGMWFERGGTIFVSMPGVPLEMKYIMSEHVLPALARKFITQVIVHKNIMTYGSAEARLAEILTGFESGLPGFIRLAYLPSLGIIKLRLTGTGKDRSTVESAIKEQTAKLYSIIPDLIYAEDEETLEITVGKLLLEKNKSVCTAESCTGGNISRMLTSVPGSSGYYKGSVIAYSNEVKSSILGVQPEIIKKYGAVSQEVATDMAKGARKILSADFAIAVTGIAGPSGATDEKPVGTVFISVDSAAGNVTEKFVFGSDRSINIMRFSIAALNMVRKQILGSH